MLSLLPALPQSTLFPAAPAWETSGSIQWEYRGTDVADVGDMNGDGHDELLVLSTGTPGLSGVHGRGRAELYYGSASGYGATPDWTVRGQDGYHLDPLDWCARAARDVNGDGYADLVVSSSRTSSSLTPGGVFVFHGGPQGPRRRAARTAKPQTRDAPTRLGAPRAPARSA